MSSTNFDTTLVAFMDNKLDDKVALWYLFKYGNYAKYVVVLSNIVDMNAACMDLRDFMRKMGLPADSIVVLAGHLSKKLAPHEKTFLSPTAKEAPINGNFGDIYEHVKGKINVLQSAPTPKKYIIDLVNMSVIKSFHLIHGFNSEQLGADPKDTPGLTLEWLKSIQNTIQAKHAEAKIRFTNNFASFEGRSGAQQPYNTMKALLPLSHLEAALRDPFVGNQFEDVNTILIDAFEEKIIQNKLSLIPEDIVGPLNLSTSDLYELVLIARKNETSGATALRAHFVSLIDDVIIPDLTSVKHHYDELLLKTNIKEDERVKAQNVLAEIGRKLPRIARAVRAAFTQPLHVELCDANHVLAVMISDGDLDSTDLPQDLVNPIKSCKWAPIEFVIQETRDGKFIVFENVAEGGCGTTINGLKTDHILLAMQALK